MPSPPTATEFAAIFRYIGTLPMECPWWSRALVDRGEVLKEASQVGVGDERTTTMLARDELAGTDGGVDRVAAKAGQDAALGDRMRSAADCVRVNRSHVEPSLVGVVNRT